jgi:uncharacterized protein YaaQ
MDNELPLTEKTLLFWAIIQAQDLENAQEALTNLGFVSTRLPSVGGFLGRRNATLLVGVNESQLPQALEALKENCRQRIEYIAVPLESAPLPLPTPTPITIGGATIFTLKVDHFEVI